MRFISDKFMVGTSRSEWGESWHEEVETRERDHVDGQLSQVSVQLTWESEASGNTRHGGRHQMVQVTIGWCGQLEGTEADIVQGFVINAVGLIGVLDELMHRQSGVVRLNDGIGDFRRRDDREGVHDTVWVLLTDLRDQQGAHTRAGTASQRVGQLKS